MADDDKPRGGLTRRELFQGLGAGALVGGALAAGGRRAHAAVPTAEVLGPGSVALDLRVNGKPHTVHVEPRTTLLGALRNDLGLTGAKPVCERGACGACTVMLDGAAVNSCMLLALDAAGGEVTTVEGLAHGGELTALQRAFVDHDALQCGFCTPGMVMACSALVAHNPHPTGDDVRSAIAGNLCRCGTYPKVIAATLAATGGKGA